MLERENKRRCSGSRESSLLFDGVLELMCAWLLHWCVAVRQERDLLSYRAVLVLA